MTTECDAHIRNFCEYRTVDTPPRDSSNYSYYSDIFGDSDILGNNILHVTAYAKNEENEIEVTIKSEPQRNLGIATSRMSNLRWYDDNGNKYNCDKIYLKAGTEWWFKYHILSLHEKCVRTHIEQFDKNEMFTYAVTYGKLPEDIEDGPSTTDDKDIFSILLLLKPDSLNDSNNNNILLIACKRLNLKLVKFLVENCDLKLKSYITQKILKTKWFQREQNQLNIYLLNELFELYYSIPGDKKDVLGDVLIKFIENLITYALSKAPPVYLINQTVLDNASKYKNKGQPHEADTKSFVKIKDDYISLLTQTLVKHPNPIESPQPKSMTATVCDALTPGRFKTRSKVHAEAGGSKKRAKKTRKQRKHRNLKRNHKK